MVCNNIGYIFECRKDTSGGIGFIEGFKVLYKGEEQHVTLTCAVDSNGDLVIPAGSTSSLGFLPLNKICQTPDDVASFVRGNKPYYAKFGTFSMIGHGTLVYDKSTKKLINSTGFGLYAPKVFLESYDEFTDPKGVSQPAFVCEKVWASDGLNCLKIGNDLYQKYITHVADSIAELDLSSKLGYLTTLTFRKG